MNCDQSVNECKAVAALSMLLFQHGEIYDLWQENQW